MSNKARSPDSETKTTGKGATHEALEVQHLPEKRKNTRMLLKERRGCEKPLPKRNKKARVESDCCEAERTTPIKTDDRTY